MYAFVVGLQVHPPSITYAPYKKSRVGKKLEVEMHVCFHLSINGLNADEKEEKMKQTELAEAAAASVYISKKSYNISIIFVSFRH